MIHDLKLEEQFCSAVICGNKSFEIRKNDRAYQSCDIIRFHCVNKYGFPIFHEINSAVYLITYVLSGYGLEENYVAFGIKKVR